MEIHDCCGERHVDENDVCRNCGCGPEDLKFYAVRAQIQGGQGRSPEDVIESASVSRTCFMLALGFILGCVILKACN